MKTENGKERGFGELERSRSEKCLGAAYTLDCRILDTTGPCTAVHTAARQAKILVEIPREI